MEETRPKRILRLLMMLSGSRRYMMAELEERLGMSARNIRRDLELIVSSGFLLACEGGYRLPTDKSANRNLKNLLHFSEEEIAILYETLSLIEGDSPVKTMPVNNLKLRGCRPLRYYYRTGDSKKSIRNHLQTFFGCRQ